MNRPNSILVLADALLRWMLPQIKGLKGIRGTEAARQLPGVLSVSTHIAPSTSIGGDFEETFAVDAWLQAETPDAIKALDQRIRELIKVDIG